MEFSMSCSVIAWGVFSGRELKLWKGRNVRMSRRETRGRERRGWTGEGGWREGWIKKRRCVHLAELFTRELALESGYNKRIKSVPCAQRS